MMKKILAIVLVVLTLCSSLAVFSSAYTEADVATAKQELARKYPYHSAYVNSGIYSTQKVTCSMSSCTREDFTHLMLFCSLCSGYYCPSHAVSHMESVHNLVPRVCGTDGCKTGDQLVYCGYCRDYFCTHHYVGGIHAFHSQLNNGIGAYCGAHGRYYTSCGVCGISFCPECNPNHEYSHYIGGQPDYECAIGGCNRNTSLVRCTSCARWFCSSHYYSEGHDLHGVQSYLNYCRVHGKYYHYCATCGERYCPDCGHTCDLDPRCYKHPVIKLTQCSVCEIYYCKSCNNHVCSGGDQCSYHPNRARVTCSLCGIEYCPDCTVHTCRRTGYCARHTSIVLSVCTTCGASYCQICTPNHICYTGNLCPLHGVLSVCAFCNKYYCRVCDPHSCVSYVQYCGFHEIYKQYCNTCNKYYCPRCDANHSCLSIGNGQFYPRASVASGNVVAGTKVSFATNSNYNIYYTLDGSVPNARSKIYTGPITIEKDTTIRAIAVHKYYLYATAVITYEYTVVADVKFSDTASIKGLNTVLQKLVEKGVFENGSKFYPNDGFTYKDLMDALKALGVDTSKVKLDKKYYSTTGDMTYQEFMYVAYKTLKADKIIENAKNGTKTLKTLTYASLVPKAAVLRAPFAAMVEQGLCYRLDFKPDETCTRAFMAMALGAAYDMMYDD